jgi:hypothetical protein
MKVAERAKSATLDDGGVDAGVAGDGLVVADGAQREAEARAPDGEPADEEDQPRASAEQHASRCPGSGSTSTKT